MYNIKLIKYYNTKSFMHQINPLCKLICLLIFILITLITKNILTLIIIIIFLIVLILLSNIPIKKYINSLIFLIPFALFIFIIDIIFKINIIFSIKSTIKLVLLVIYSILIMYTTKPNDLTYGLEKLFTPLKLFNVPVNELALSLSLSIRFIPIVFEQSDKILKSQISRGLDFKGNLRTKTNKLISILFPIFKLSMQRSESIADSLDLRLYNLKRNKTKYKLYKMTSYDNGIMFMHIILLVLYVFVEVLS
jgi:energy-coupling factor transport system permease protein